MGERRRKMKLKITMFLCVILAAIFALQTAVLADNHPEYDETPISARNSVSVQNAIDMLKLTDDQGNLQGKLDKGEIKEADLNKPNDPNKKPGDPPTRGYGEPDDGKILIDKSLLAREHLLPYKLTSFEGLVGIGDLAFTDLKNLAETLLHENTHNQQTTKESIGSDENFKNGGSDWAELEAYYAEILWKLELKSGIEQVAEKQPELKSQCDEKIKIINDQIIGVIETIDKLKIESSKDCPSPIGKVYDPKKSTWLNMGNIAGYKDTAKKKRQEMGKKMLENRRQSQITPIEPQNGGNVTLPGDNAWITIPSNSLPTPTNIEIYEMALTGLPAGLNTLSPVYELGPDETMFAHSNPARLTIRISDPGAIRDANIYRWNTNIPVGCVGQWELISSGRSIDTYSNTISVDIDHFGYYIVIGPSHPSAVGIAVIDASNDQPLKGLAITIEQDGQVIYSIAKSEEETLAPLPPGTYTVRVSQKILGFPMELASRTFEMNEPFTLTVMVSTGFLPVSSIPTLANGLASILGGLILGSVSRIIVRRFNKSRILPLMVGLAIGVAVAASLFWGLLPSIS
jgi:hypothetical protein